MHFNLERNLKLKLVLIGRTNYSKTNYIVQCETSFGEHEILLYVTWTIMNQGVAIKG